MDYFKQLSDLLAIERDEDKKSYIALTAQTSAAQRRAAGLAWYPVAIRDREIGRGDYLTVELERTTNQDIAHQFRFGASAMLFSNHNAEDRIEGTVSFVGGNRLKLTLRTDELPEWADNGKLGVDVLFDDTSYEEMQTALQQASRIVEQPTEGRLVQVLTGIKQPDFNTEAHAYRTFENLNDSQNLAVRQILSAQDVAIVHGPPGTGKTTTLVQAIQALYKAEGGPILVVAPSNAAVDLLSDKLATAGMNVLRVGNPAKVTERLLSLTLDSKMAEHTAMKEVKKLKKQAAEFKNMAHKYKRHFGKAEREQRKALFDEAHKIIKDVERTEQYILDDLVAKAQVVTATPVGCNHYSVAKLRYNTVVIDEAGQALEPMCWISILKAKKLVLAGDHQQLPPTVKSNEAAKKGLTTTLLEKCVATMPQAVTMLNMQYRMHEKIMQFSSQEFYGGSLLAHASVAQHTVSNSIPPISFVDTAGCGFDEKNEATSISNPEEAQLMYKHLLALLPSIESQYKPDNFPTMGIISPYREQLAVLQEQFNHIPQLQPYRSAITINTIDSFQGQERDIIYISLTRSNSDGVIGFLSDIRRMNVAMTRAKKCLVVVGDSATLSGHKFYADFIAYTQQIDAYVSAWEYMDY